MDWDIGFRQYWDTGFRHYLPLVLACRVSWYSGFLRLGSDLGLMGLGFRF